MHTKFTKHQKKASILLYLMIIISNCVAEATLFLPFDKVTANLIRISFLLAVLNFYKLDKYAGENWTKKISQILFSFSVSCSMYIWKTIITRTFAAYSTHAIVCFIFICLVSSSRYDDYIDNRPYSKDYKSNLYKTSDDLAPTGSDWPYKFRSSTVSDLVIHNPI